MSYTEYKNVNFVEFNDDELIAIRNQMEMEYGEFVDAWGKEVAFLINEKHVDPYSFWGEKKINKVIKKYADKTSDIQIIIEDIDKELFNRDNYKFQQSFLGKTGYYDDSLTQKEFFEKEQLKTLKYKQSIGKSGEEDDEEYDEYDFRNGGFVDEDDDE